MAEKKKAKTGEKAGRQLTAKHRCPKCESDSHVVRFTGYGQNGLFWVCDKECGYTLRTR